MQLDTYSNVIKSYNTVQDFAAIDGLNINSQQPEY